MFLTEIRFLSKLRSINYYSKIMNPQVHSATIISKIIIFYQLSKKNNNLFFLPVLNFNDKSIKHGTCKIDLKHISALDELKLDN